MVIRADGDTPFDHTSTIKTLCERWHLQRLPEPKAHQAPLSHLVHQIIELSAAVAGEAVPVLKTAEEAVQHLLGHVHRPGK